MTFALMGSALADNDVSAISNDLYKGQVVIIHTNDVHGQIDGYAKVAALKAQYEAQGAYVILADAGDYSQGQVYVSSSKGATAIELMNAVGYDISTIGNHELDYGFAQLKDNLSTAKFTVVAANISENGKASFEANKVFTTEDGVKIGFFGLATPETATKANPALIKGVSFGDDAGLVATAKAQVAALKAEGCKLIVCLGHLGVDEESVGHESLDVIKNVDGIDLFIDGHSHSVIDGNKNDYNTGKTMLVSTGTAFKNIGVVVYGDGKLTASLVEVTDDMTTNADVKAVSDAIIAKIDADMGAVFAKSEVELNGAKAPGNRTMETNNGDLICDAMLWKATSEGISADAAITNGGGIRAAIKVGDVTKKDINTVLPFGNTLAVVKVTGAKLLEALEASTYSVPTAVGGFPQVAGIEYTINTAANFDAGDNYPSSTYAAPKSINRVSIQTVNGKAFDKNATYTIVTNNFVAAGGDTYYSFTTSPVNYDLGFVMDEAVMEYVTTVLGGKITSEKYGSTQGRITLAYDICAKFIDVAHKDWFEDSVSTCVKNNLMNGTSATTFAPKTSMTRAMFVTMLYNLAGSPDVEVTTKFTDVASDIWYAKAVAWAVEKGITDGMTETTFAPNAIMTREQMASFIYRNAGSPEATGTLTYSDASAVSGWAVNAVVYCTENGIMNGSNNVFSASGNATRAEGATVLARLFAAK